VIAGPVFSTVIAAVKPVLHWLCTVYVIWQEVTVVAAGWAGAACRAAVAGCATAAEAAPALASIPASSAQPATLLASARSRGFRVNLGIRILLAGWAAEGGMCSQAAGGGGVPGPGAG
jgi:hypothetical protein